VPALTVSGSLKDADAKPILGNLVTQVFIEVKSGYITAKKPPARDHVKGGEGGKGGSGGNDGKSGKGGKAKSKPQACRGELTELTVQEFENLSQEDRNSKIYEVRFFDLNNVLEQKAVGIKGKFIELEYHPCVLLKGGGEHQEGGGGGEGGRGGGGEGGGEGGSASRQARHGFERIPAGGEG
jgi:hypothetical protein